MSDHIRIPLALKVCDPGLHVHLNAVFLLIMEHSRTSSQVTIATEASLSAIREEDVVVVAREVVVAISACADPAYLTAFFRDCEHTGIDRLAVDCLLLMACNRIHVAQGHELLKRSVHEDEVTVFVVMRIQVLLFFKPSDCLNTKARGAWQTFSA